MFTDPIADMLTRIRNAQTAKHDTVEIPYSTVKESIGVILLEEGFIASQEIIVGENTFKTIKITLKYGARKSGIITGIKRISKPGLRIYAKKDKLPKVLGGLGVAIISTSKGIMTDKKARALGHGGEVIAYVW